jgi:hypothetical protein
MENVGIFYGHLNYLTVSLCLLWPLGIFCGHLVHFSRVGILYREKSGNLDLRSTQSYGKWEPIL